MDHVEGKNVVVEVSMAKYWTTDMVFIGGLTGVLTLRRIWLLRRNSDITCLAGYSGYPIFAGTNEIMKMIAARFMGL
jgi:hypothetical protein